jgi:TPR repeat protein
METGAGAPQDFAEAATWYRKAADKGHAGAQFYLGLLYASGRGVPSESSHVAQSSRRLRTRGSEGS